MAPDSAVAMRVSRRRSSPIVRAAGTPESDRAPGAAAPPQGRDQHVALNRRMGVTDVARQHVEIPVGLFRQRKEEVGLRAAGMERGDAAVSRLKNSRVSRSAWRSALCGSRTSFR